MNVSPVTLFGVRIFDLFFSDRQIRKSKKRMCFVVRMLDFGIQLASTGRVAHLRGTPPCEYARLFADVSTLPLNEFFKESHTAFTDFVHDVSYIHTHNNS